MRYFVCIFLFLLTANVHAQKVRFVAESNATDVVLGNAFKVSFRLENDGIRGIDFPDFENAGFRIMEGPMSASQHININGRKRYTESYSFILAPNTTGKLTIPAVKLRSTSGRVLRSKPLTINCVKPSQNSTRGSNNRQISSISDKVFFKVEANRTDVVVGEQVILYFNIYTKTNIASIELAKEPKFDNDYSFPIRHYDKSARIAVVNGQQYATKTIHAISVFPSKEGTLVIDPAEMRIAIGDVDPFNPFARATNYSLYSDPVNITVESLMGKNPDFTGGVGKYEMQLYTEQNQISTDELVKITMRIQGEGDLKQLFAPKIKMNNNKPFDQYPPKIKEDLKEGQAGLGGTKTFTYTFEPQEIGELELQPNFTYYDVDERKFISKDTIIKIVVSQGNRKVGRSAIVEAERQDSLKRQMELLDFTAALKTAKWVSAPRSFMGTPLFGVLSICPFVLLGAAMAFKKWQVGQKKRVAQKRHKTKAERFATTQLAQAKSYLNAGNSQDFFKVIGAMLKEYLGLKLGISLAELNKNQIIDQLRKIEVEDHIIFQLEKILKMCEESTFAAQNYQSTMEDTYMQSQDLIQKFEKSLNNHA